MKRNRIIIAGIALIVCAALIAWLLGRGGEPQTAEQSPEEQLLGVWMQTQEYLDYENENIHAVATPLADKERLEFNKDGTCGMTHPAKDAVLFAYEYRDGAVILTANNWAPQRYLLQEGKLVDPETDIPKYEKQK